VREGRIELEFDEGCVDALVVCPDDVGRWPPVILLDEDAGEAAGKARRLASHGFFVLAPQMPADPIEDAFDAWLDYLARERLTDDARVGVLAYGQGATLALQLAAVHGERIAALAVFRPVPLEPESLHHLAGCLNAVVHLGYAAPDIAAQAPETRGLEAELRRAGVDFEVEIYPAEPGVAAVGTVDDAPDPASGHWASLVELFKRTLGFPAGAASRALAAPPP
jgi:dienelactone hydrolase